MLEFVLEDGRKAEKTEKNPDPMTKVTEVYVEPKPQKKLTQRITERLCVCEQEIETLDEATGVVISREVNKLCEGHAGSGFEDKTTSPMQAVVEEKLKKSNLTNYLFFGIVAVQLAVLGYVVFLM